MVNKIGPSVAKIAASESGVFSMPKFNIKCEVSLM